jgi:alkylation response protein AidB-like acyl-CoA dehydrogenase
LETDYIKHLEDEFGAGPRSGDSFYEKLDPRGIATSEDLQAMLRVVDGPETRRDLRMTELDGHYPARAVQAMAARGLPSFLMDPPSAFRSPGRPSAPSATIVHGAALSALLAQRSGTLAVAVGVNYLGLIPILTAGSDRLCEDIAQRVHRGAFAGLFLTELPQGSNLLHTTAFAEPIGGPPPTHYRLRGEKSLINGGSRHEIMVVLARTGAAKANTAAGSYSLFVVPRGQGVTELARWRTLAVRGADIAGIRMEDVHIPADHQLGRGGDGFDILQSTFALTRAGVGSYAAGSATGAFALAHEYCRRRMPYGHPILRFGAIAEHLLRMEALTFVASATALKGINACNALGLGASLFSAVAKHVCCAHAEAAVEEGRRALGSRALLEEGPYASFVRDVVIFGVFDGSSHLMLDQLRRRLAQVAAGHGSPPGDVLATARRVYTEPLRPARAVARQKSDVFVPDTASYLARLEGICVWPHARALGALLTSLLDAVRSLRAETRWERDQALSFEAATVYSHIEALVATLELGDPGLRRELGTNAHDAALSAPDGPFENAMIRGACAVAEHIRIIHLKIGLALPPYFGAIEADLWSRHEIIRSACEARMKES